MSDEDDDAVVNWNGLKTQFGIPYCRTQVWRKMKDGSFPRSFKLDKHHSSPPVWYKRVIRKWLADRAQ